MISLYNKFIFVHIPKCGGTSIFKQVEHLVPGFNSQMHIRYEEFHNSPMWKVHGESPDNFYKFTVIRNPWDRIGSFFNHIVNWPNPFYHKFCVQNYIISFEDFILNLDFIVDMVKPSNPDLERSIEPLLEWILIDGENLFDDIIELEFLNERWPEICKLIGIEYKPLGRERQRSKDGNYKHLYTPEMVKSIENVYGEEIEYFKFSYEGIGNGRSRIYRNKSY